MKSEEKTIALANKQAYNLLGSIAEPKNRSWILVEIYNYHKVYSLVGGLIGSFKGKQVVDVGCGNAAYLSLLSFDCKLVVGLDISVEMLKLHRKTQGQKSNLHYVVADALHLPFRNESFDVATTIQSAHHFPNIWKAMKEMVRVADKCAFYEPNYESFIHHLLERFRRGHTQDIRFTEKHTYDLVEYKSIGFSRRQIRSFLQQFDVKTRTLLVFWLPMEISWRIFQLSRSLFKLLNVVGDTLERIPLINNQIGGIIVVVERGNSEGVQIHIRS